MKKFLLKLLVLSMVLGSLCLSNLNSFNTYAINSATNGDATYGDASSGNATAGNATRGDATAGNATDGETTEDVYATSLMKLHIEGDDWGPAVDKTILTLDTTVKAEDLAAENFTVTESKEATDWTDYSFPATIATSTRTVLEVYLSDAEGNKVSATQGNIITIEMYTSPSEGSPFRYIVSSGYNKWCDPYELDVVGTAGNVTISCDQMFDLTDDNQWINEKAQSFDVTNTYTDSNGYTYKYGEYTPTEDDTQNALIIWLHGAGEGQALNTDFENDNYIDILGNEVTAYVSDEFQELFGGAYVITPQAPTMWMDCTGNGDYCTSNNTDKSVYAEGLFELIQSYVASNPDVDPNRIIIGGCSNGGYMTMRMIVDHPGYFYKAFPICEALTDKYITNEQIQALADSRTGIWFTFADTDTTVDPTTNSIATIARLRAAGADVHYTEWAKTEDITGRFYASDEVTPYEYSGHWSWIYFDNNANNTCNIDGQENEWQWLAEEPEIVTGTQYLHITGDDWGPGVDKTIITLDTNVDAKDLAANNFTVTEIKEATDWANNPYAACISTSSRTVLDVYLSDANGNKVDDAEGNIVTVEMYISPSEGSPFRYVLQSGFNKWCTPYELVVTGNAGKVTISADQEIDLTDNTTWFCETADKFDVTKSYTASDGYTYQYGEYIPAEDDGQNALIIWLHGAGEGQAEGQEYHNDVYVDLLGNEVPALVSDEFQDLFDGAYVLVPQCPTMWMDNGTGSYTSDGTSCYSEGLFELIDAYVKANPDIDPDRVIIGGCSNGGYMTMREVIDHPGYFYKAFPICEALLDSCITDEQIQALADSRTGIWFTFADTDSTVDPTVYSKPTIERLVAAGADVHYTEWAKVEDVSGRFDSADGTHYEYSGHWSWIYFDNNANNTCNIDGAANEWVWLASLTNDATSGDATPGNATSGDATPGDVTPGDSTGGDTTVISGSYGDNFTYSIIGDTFYLYGTGAMDDADPFDGVPWGNLPEVKSCTKVVVQDGITRIGGLAFARFSSLTTVEIPESVTAVGYRAFAYCTSLKSIEIPSNLQEIGSYAFIGCSSVESIQVDSENPVYDSRDNCNAIIETATNKLICGCLNTVIPEGITSIDECAFADLSIETIDIPNTVTSIGTNAFSGCSSLTSIILPEALTSIGSYAFSNCSSLQEIVIPSGVTVIDSGTFYNCTPLTSVTIPATVTTIDLNSFSGCGNLTIHCYEGSYAQEYATANGFKCELIQTVHTHSYTAVHTDAVGDEQGYTTYTCEECSDSYIIYDAKVDSDSSIAITEQTVLDAVNNALNTLIQDNSDETTSKAVVSEEVANVIEEANESGEEVTITNELIAKNLDEEELSEQVKEEIINQLGSDDEVNQYIDLSIKVTATVGEETVEGNLEELPEEQAITFTVVVQSQGEYDTYYVIRVHNGVAEIIESVYNAEEGTVTFETNKFSEYAIVGHNHNYEVTEVAATFTTQGYTLHTCTICGDTYKDNYTDMLKENVVDKYSDVYANQWYTENVQYVVDKGLMSGYGGTTLFGTNDTLTRAQMVQVLYNMAGNPEVTDYTATSKFSDVHKGDWYEDAVNWAYNNGITVGMGNVFGADSELTREQMVKFLNNYAVLQGLEVSQTTDITGYYGYSGVSDWARESMSWAIATGLVSGVQHQVNGVTVKDLSAKGTATRAQLATVLAKFCTAYNL